MVIRLEGRLTQKFGNTERYKGSIPLTVPLLRADNRIFAGGNIVLRNIAGALTPDAQGKTDQKRIDYWGQYSNLADLCVVIDDLVVLQPDSGFLTGIRGIVIKEGQIYIAVDADDVKAAIVNGSEGYFANQLSESEIVHYKLKDGTPKQKRVQRVILFPYDGYSFKLNAPQSNAIAGKKFKRDEIIHGRDMVSGEIIEGDRVIHPAWEIYDAKTIKSLVQKMNAFRFEDRDFDLDRYMGFYLPKVPTKSIGNGLALCVYYLSCGCRLIAAECLYFLDSYVIGVDKDTPKA